MTINKYTPQERQEIEQVRAHCFVIQDKAVHLTHPEGMTRFQEQQVMPILVELLRKHAIKILIAEPNEDVWDLPETREMIREDIKTLRKYLDRWILITPNQRQRIQAHFFTQGLIKGLEVVFVDSFEEALTQLD